MASTSWTCGQGLAATAALPASLGDVVSAMAENLDLHVRALLVDDADARSERDVYQTLAGELRDAAALLATAAARMVAARDLPMGPHDTSPMTDPRAKDAFRRLTEAEKGVAALLAGRVAEDEKRLDTMERP